jgi:Secretion system C-terminal sorting domain
MKAHQPFLLGLLLFIQLISNAQTSWYQSQDGQLQPNGTYAAGILSLTRQSFVAAYMWRLENENYTWKISKSHTNGTEQRTFFITAPYGIVEMKTGYRNSLYLLLRSFPFAQDPQYTIYKLDSNLVVKAQRTISLADTYTIFNLSVFELDEAGNLYLAGDGQYRDGPGYSPASFVMKADKNLATRWTRIDSVQTSYSRLHIERNGTVRLIEDFYTFFPDIKVQKISAAGQLQQTRVYQTDPGRQSLTTLLDRDDNLLISGTTDGTAGQSLYLNKIARHNGQVVYRKTFFNSVAANLDDVELDEDGQLYVLMTQYFNTGSQCRLARIQPRNGSLYWSRTFPFAQDSCMLRNIVMAGDDRLYVIGDRRSGSFYTKGFSVQVKRNGQRGEAYISPDSVAFAKSNTLFQGISDQQNRLIVVGNTNDLDTVTGSSTYFRSFAMGMGRRNRENDCDDDRPSNSLTESLMAKGAMPETIVKNISVYPNPATDRITVQNPDPEKYNQVLIYDIRGNLLSQQYFNSHSASFDLSRMSAGFYLVVLRSTKGAADQTKTFSISR